MRHLGISYENGRGTAKNEVRAFEMFEQAANAGNHLGYFNKTLFLISKIIIIKHSIIWEYAMKLQKEQQKT